MKKVAAIVLAVIGALAIASPASAHVTVSPEQAAQGSYARLAFQVPNESDTASTVKLEVQMPENAALTAAAVQPVQGWSATVTRSGDKVSLVTWEANAGVGIKPGEFQEFVISAGPLPTGVDQVLFKSLQTYSDGTVVRWIEPPKADAEHPAPALRLVPASTSEALPEKESSPSSPVGWIALGVALLAAILGGLALVRSRRP